MIRAVLDTNIIISALFWGGFPRLVFSAALDKRFIMLTTEALTTELQRVLAYPKFVQQIAMRNLNIPSLVNSYQASAVNVMPAEVPEDVVRDLKDTMILACAVGRQAQFVVSGDKDLTSLGEYVEIPIITPEQFWQRLNDDNK